MPATAAHAMETPTEHSESRASLHAADALVESMDRTGTCACVGLDPVLERLPDACRVENPVEAIRGFSLGVVEAIAERVCCIKPQSACFERYGPEGIGVLDEVIDAAAARDMPVILDAKRGDIGISAEHYAVAAFTPRTCGGSPAWMTVNGYLGPGTIEPMLEHGGVFVLVRTSNPDSGTIQELLLDDGRSVSEAMADMVVDLGAGRIGQRGWSDLGAVVAATHRSKAEALRTRMPGVVLLVPGIGAQGGRIEDCGPLCDPDGHGAVLTASRSVLYAPGEGDWRQAVSAAVDDLADAAGRMAGLR